MSDFFEEPAAMQEMDQSKAHNLVIEARAELNSAEGRDEETIRIYRGVGEKFRQIRDIIGRAKYADWIAKRAKIGTRQIQRIIQLAESNPALPLEEQIAILWGNPVKQKEGGRPAANHSPTAFNRPKFFGGINRVKTHAKAFVEARNLGESPAYQKICKAVETIETEFKKLEKAEAANGKAT